MAAEDSKVFVQEYTPEQAGQRVGWVSVDQRTYRNYHNDWIEEANIKVAVATVGEEGAQLAYTRMECDDGVRHIPFSGYKSKGIPADTWGFVAVSGMSAEVIRGRDGVDYSPVGGVNIEDFVTAGPTIPVVEKHWFDDESLCIELLRGEMEKIGSIDAYPTLYYWLNAHLAHEGIDRSRLRSHVNNNNAARRPQAPIADPEMQTTTEQQLEIASTVATELRAALVADRTMLRSLDTLSGVNPDDIPDMFEMARKDVSRREGIVIENAGRLIVPALVYSPVGSRPSGREQPYMDATPGDKHPNGDYARELEFIKDGNSRPVVKELEREIAELEKRVRLADRGCGMFSQLLASEQAHAS